MSYGKPVLVIGLLLALGLPSVPVPAVRADSSGTLVTTLPTPTADASAVWTGHYAYIFGGRYSSQNGLIVLNNIVRFDPVAGTTQVMNGALPTARWGTSAFWDGHNAYIFGGADASGKPLSQIVEYNITTDSATSLSVSLPTGLYWSAASGSGAIAFLFGGVHVASCQDAVCGISSILRFDPSRQTVRTMNASLPISNAGAAAAPVGQDIYILGGYNASAAIYDYNISHDSIILLSPSLPLRPGWESAFSDGHNVFAVGGWSVANGGTMAGISQFNPVLDVSQTMASGLGRDACSAPTVWNGTTAFVFGGRSGAACYNPPSFGGGESDLSLIQTYALQPGAPMGLYGYSGPDAHNITIRWQPPPSNSYSTITGYNIYRDGVFVQSLATAASSVVDTSVPTGSHSYVVTAYSPSGESPKTETTGVATYGVPSSPTLSTKAGPGVGQITLHWSTPASNGGLAVTAYRVLRSSSSGAEAAIQDTTGLSYVDTGLPAGSTGYYEVEAINHEGASPPSAQSSATTFTYPSTPYSFQITSGPQAGQLNLSWSPPSASGGEPVTSYRVYRGNASGSETFLRNVSSTTLGDTGLANNATYYYRISAVTAVGEGPLCGEQAGSTFAGPGVPTHVVAFAGPGRGNVTIQWQSPPYTGGTPVTQYELLGGSNATSLAVVANTTTLNFTDHGLANSQQRFYTVSAKNIVGLGLASLPVSVSSFAPPTVSISVSTPPYYADQAIQFSAAASAKQGTISTIAWSFGYSTTGAISTTTHSYSSVGNYTVSVTATDSYGLTGTVSKVIEVVATPPSSGAGTNQSSSSGSSSSSTGSATAPGANANTTNTGGTGSQTGNNPGSASSASTRNGSESAGSGSSQSGSTGTTQSRAGGSGEQFNVLPVPSASGSDHDVSQKTVALGDSYSDDLFAVGKGSHVKVAVEVVNGGPVVVFIAPLDNLLKYPLNHVLDEAANMTVNKGSPRALYWTAPDDQTYGVVVDNGGYGHFLGRSDAVINYARWDSIFTDFYQQDAPQAGATSQEVGGGHQAASGANGKTATPGFAAAALILAAGGAGLVMAKRRR
ncbi:MAG: fibronectin type III domain-containing protein [Thermoplasmatota archaeon]